MTKPPARLSAVPFLVSFEGFRPTAVTGHSTLVWPLLCKCSLVPIFHTVVLLPGRHPFVFQLLSEFLVIIHCFWSVVGYSFMIPFIFYARVSLFCSSRRD